MVECPLARRHVDAMRRLDQLNFSNSYARLPEPFHTRLPPTPLQGTRLLSFNPAAAELLDLGPVEALHPQFVRYFSGQAHLPGSEPLAALYAGHQFGHYVPQLGDGRAILLGEVQNRRGERWEVQLKGAGLTPYSRRGDGRAVLRSTIREYLAGEAMHALGIPTTRALCLFGSDEEVGREEVETGALLVRLAPSHVRFGSFEVFYYRRQFDHLRRLANYVIEHHYPDLHEDENPYLALFREVTTRTARLIAQWQAVGFAHGVMNTDNMSILGLTLDYGPYAFLDDFDPALVCNHSDYQGRYAFDRQPDIAHWNLSCLGQALLPLLGESVDAAAEQANAVLGSYTERFHTQYQENMARKLGLREWRPGDERLLQDLLQLLAANHVDYSNFFRALGRFDSAPGTRNAVLRDLFPDRAAFDRWAEDYRTRLAAEQTDNAARRHAMDHINPKYILRNYLAQQAIARAQQGDNSEIEHLLRLLQAPFDEHPGQDAYAAPPPEWGRRLAISCSS
jgi:uncharacterized protein YdiU (UPF0061 family)